MVKIPLTVKQINFILSWRDEHKELVRACVVPFPSCSIISENGVKISVDRISSEPLSTFYKFTVTDCNANLLKGRFLLDVETSFVHHDFPKLTEEQTQDALTVWASVMAYIVNFEPQKIKLENDGEKSISNNSHKALQRKKKKRSESVLYLNPIKFIADRENAAQRKYSLPKCVFSVRGHYRHYKSGKIVFVHPYEKYAKKEKDKRNKIVKIKEV